MSKVYEYYKEKIERDAVPTKNEGLAKLQEQINTAEETILQFEVNMSEMAKYYEKR